jgi:hypothetical protein
LFGFVVLHNKLCFSWFPSHSFAFVYPIPLSIKLHLWVLFCYFFFMGVANQRFSSCFEFKLLDVSFFVGSAI